MTPFARSETPPLHEVTHLLKPSWTKRQLDAGPLVARLERELRAYLGCRHVVACSSGTAAITVALRAFTLLRGDVPAPVAIVPAFTFGATAAAVHGAGLSPFAFCDVDPDSGVAWRAQFENAVGGDAARANDDMIAVCVHAYGQPYSILAPALPTIYDAAPSLGSDIHHACFETAACFSLSSTKVITAGQGGCIATDRDDIAETAHLLVAYGHDAMRAPVLPGWNFKLTEANAAAGLASLKRAKTTIRRRRAAAMALMNELDNERLCTFAPNDPETWNGFMAAAIVGRDYDRDRLIGRLQQRGVDARAYYWPALHRSAAYKQDVKLPNAEDLASRVIAFPTWSGLGERTAARIAKIANKEVRRCRK